MYLYFKPFHELSPDPLSAGSLYTTNLEGREDRQGDEGIQGFAEKRLNPSARAGAHAA